MKFCLKSILLVFFLSLVIPSQAQSNKWRDIYKAKKKDTLFGIAKK